MNTQALEYWLDGHDIEFERHTWGYLLPETRSLSNAFLGEISACGGKIQVANMAQGFDDCLMIVDPEAEKSES
jgi:hypothetical protein